MFNKKAKSMALVCMIVFLVICCGIMLYNICGSVYTWADHCGWEENSQPDKNAKIQNITSERVQYTRNGAKLKTKITFSDGFYFITYKTDRDDGVISYKIYLSDELREKIINLAIEKHNLSVEQFINDKQYTGRAVRTVDAKVKKDMTQIKIEIVNDEKYINLKKDDRIAYLYTLKKQTVSELNKLNDAFIAENNKIRDIPVDIAKYIKPSNISYLKNNVKQLENKMCVIDELIALELVDKEQKKEYEKLTKKLTAKAQDNKAEKVSVYSVDTESEQIYIEEDDDE